MQCELCAEFGRTTPAAVRALIEMAGAYPTYLLCDGCFAEIEANVTLVEALPDVRAQILRGTDG